MDPAAGCWDRVSDQAQRHRGFRRVPTSYAYPSDSPWFVLTSAILLIQLIICLFLPWCIWRNLRSEPSTKPPFKVDCYFVYLFVVTLSIFICLPVLDNPQKMLWHCLYIYIGFDTSFGPTRGFPNDFSTKDLLFRWPRVMRRKTLQSLQDFISQCNMTCPFRQTAYSFVLFWNEDAFLIACFMHRIFSILSSVRDWECIHLRSLEVLKVCISWKEQGHGGIYRSLYYQTSKLWVAPCWCQITPFLVYFWLDRFHYK